MNTLDEVFELAVIVATWPTWFWPETFTPKPYDWQRENRRDYGSQRPQ